MATHADLIQKEFDLLEQNSSHLHHLINSISVENYLRQPVPNAWSIAQVANHLFLSEQLSLAYVKKKLSYPDSVPPFQIKSWAGVYIIRLVFATSWKRKAPNMINMWGDQPILAWPELQEKWNTQRQEMITFLHSHQDKFGNHLVYRHPFAGRMTMRQMLMFFNDHLRHHTRQVKRIMKATGNQ